LLFSARKDGRITARHNRSTKQDFQILSDRGRRSLGPALKRSASHLGTRISAMAILYEDNPCLKSGQP
jgi:hypothetical protein